MNLNQRFAAFCAQKCLHLWKAPKEVIDWLDNPTDVGAAQKAYLVAWSVEEALATHGALLVAAWAAHAAVYADWSALSTAHASHYATDALSVSEEELRQEFVSTWSEAELGITDPEWIEFATVEILNRAEDEH